MTEKEALDAIKRVISPETLSYVQEVVFTQSWEGQLYPEIAKAIGYHPEYIRDVGAQLWRSLSDCLGQKVTKKNVRFVLNNLAEEDLAKKGQIGMAASSLPAASQSESHTESHTESSWEDSHSQISDLLSTEATTTQLAFPSVGLQVNSPFYVPRPPAEEQAFNEIKRPGGLLRIKSPSNMGKTSLILRALEYARQEGARTVLINIQEADTAILEDLGLFLRWFCRNVAQQLELENKLDEYWDEEIGNKVSCKIYFREYVLAQLSVPVVLALDEVDQLFDYPSLVQEFLPMLRVWHEEAAELAVWQKLRLVLSYNTEVYVPLKISQSPFNIGLSVQLPKLSMAQTEMLLRQYHLPSIGEEELTQIRRLHKLVAGHPYLIQLALYWLSERSLELATLIDEAPTQAGIYSCHLLRHWQIVERQECLKSALKEIISSPEKGAEIDSLIAYQLERMGLVELSGNQAHMSSELYYLYFKNLLLDQPLQT